ncbi:MAG: hypothetical protein J5978_00430 [Spirochaetaceae bacterium]|nr:hypothetical protein [Spirochaetaceae bacterium]
MALEFVERCKENSEFRGTTGICLQLMLLKKTWVSDWSPAEGVPDDNFVGGWNGAKAKGRK